MNLIRRLFFNLWLRRKITGPTADGCLTLPLAVLDAEVATVQRLGPELSIRQKSNLAKRRLMLAAVGWKITSYEQVQYGQVDANTQQWWDG